MTAPDLGRPPDRSSRGAAWVPLAGAAVAAALLGTTADGARAVAIPSVPLIPAPGGASAAGTAQAGAAAGTLLLVLRDSIGTFALPVTGLAPGDTATRYVDVVETGTLDGRQLAVALTADGPLAPALSVALDACRRGAWSAASGRCSGTVERLLAPTAVAALSRPRVLDPLGPARRTALRVTLALADRQERALNGVLPAGSLQGAQAGLRWTFSVVQG